MSWQVQFLHEKKYLKLISRFSRARQREITEKIQKLLGTYGPAVMSSGHGKALGAGLYELKLDLPPEVLLRVFFVVKGQSVIVVLSAYDKKANDSRTWQNRQILAARRLQKDLEKL